MIQKNRNKKMRATLVRMLLLLTIIVWVSSFTQLLFFRQIYESKTILMFVGALFAGIALDIISVFLLTLPGIFSGKKSSPLTLSSLFYVASFTIYGRPFIPYVLNHSVLVQSLVKVAEFWCLITFNMFCTILIPNLVDHYIDQRKLR
jgi:hypothetical protein